MTVNWSNQFLRCGVDVVDRETELLGEHLVGTRRAEVVLRDKLRDAVGKAWHEDENDSLGYY